MPLYGCMSVPNASALLLCFRGLKGELIISFFSSLILWLISVSHTHSCFAGQLLSAFGFAGPDLLKSLPNAGISLGVDFSMPVEFLLSFLPYVVSQGVSGCRLKFL